MSKKLIRSIIFGFLGIMLVFSLAFELFMISHIVTFWIGMIFGVIFWKEHEEIEKWCMTKGVVLPHGYNAEVKREDIKKGKRATHEIDADVRSVRGGQQRGIRELDEHDKKDKRKKS